MTSKDFNAIAAILKHEHENARNLAEPRQRAVVGSLERVTVRLAGLCAQGNPDFDFDRFYKAASADPR